MQTAADCKPEPKGCDQTPGTSSAHWAACNVDSGSGLLLRLLSAAWSSSCTRILYTRGGFWKKAECRDS